MNSPARSLPPHPRNFWARLDRVLACIDAGLLNQAREQLERITNSAQLGRPLLEAYARYLDTVAGNTPGFVPAVRGVEDYWRASIGGLRLAPLCRTDERPPVPAGYNPELVLPRHVGVGNDYRFLVDAVNRYRAAPAGAAARPTILVVLYADSAAQLDRQLAILRACDYPPVCIHVLALSAGNWAPRPASLPFALTPLHYDVDRPLAQLNGMLFQQKADFLLFLPELAQGNPHLLLQLAHFQKLEAGAVFAFPAGEELGTRSVLDSFDCAAGLDWHRELFGFRKVGACNLGLSLERFRRVGGFSAELHDWNVGFLELAYRLYLDGAWFLPAPAIRKDGDVARYPKAADDFSQYCATPWHRKREGTYRVPKVSIYVPSHNNGRFIVHSVRSALEQDFPDLEVCISDDGSNDDTLARLQDGFGENPRVRFMGTPNGGIGWASNRAVEMCRGLYIGQLDSDDVLKPGAIRKLVHILDERRNLACAYTSAERIDAEGNYLQPEYSFPVYSREKMLLTSIAHHFRMFRRQAWARTAGFREDILNAVDYDMFLKLSELGPFYHLDEVLYERRWHGNNTSLVNEATQTRNTMVVQNMSLRRQGLDRLWEAVALDPSQPRKVSFRRKAPTTRIFYWPDYTTSNPYQKLLYNPLRTHPTTLYDIVSADLPVALKALKDNPGDGPVWFHLHWLNALTDMHDNATTVRESVQVFLRDLTEFRNRGGKLVWTIHNALSHDARHPAIELMLMQQLSKLADIIHLHSLASLDEIGAGIELPRDKVVVVPHGNYINYYPSYLERSEARRILGCSDDEFVIVFTGQLRPYKGVEQLLQAVGSLREDVRVRLVIAGRGTDEYEKEVRSIIAALKGSVQVTLLNQFVDDNSLQVLFRAADIAAYPYRRILTSGSAVLAMSFGVPPLLSRVGMTAELITDGVDGFLFDASDSADLVRALRAALHAYRERRLDAMGNAAKVRVAQLDWSTVCQLFG